MKPRIRTIKPDMWADERIGALSRDARLLFVGLVTMADDEGRFRALASGILGHCFPYDEDAANKLKKWVGEIKESGMVSFYVVDGVPYGAFRHWTKHQRVNRPSESELPSPPDSLNDHGSFSDQSVIDHGSFTSSRAGARPNPNPNPFPSLDVVRLTERLGERIRANDPKAKPHVKSDRWQTDMRLLLDERGGDVQEVERVIDWCQSDSFWRSNILSPAKLRKQFSQLVLKAGGGTVVSINPQRPKGRFDKAAGL